MILERNLSNDFIPKYKIRYDEFGNENIYGKYDTNGIYRGNDMYFNPYGISNNKTNRYNNNNDDNSNSSDNEEEEEEKEEEEESSGEYPPNYFDLTTTNSFIYDNNDYYNDLQPKSSSLLLKKTQQRPVSSNKNRNNDIYVYDLEKQYEYCNQCKLLKRKNNMIKCIHHKEEEEEMNTIKTKNKHMEQVLNDIKSVLSRPIKNSEDSNLYIGMIKTFMERYETSSKYCIKNNNDDYNDNGMVKKKRKINDDDHNHHNNNKVKSVLDLHINNNKPIVKRNDEIDKEYRLRIGDTDCFNCKLCDPTKLTEIRINYWEGHCQMNIHKQRKELDIEHKKQLGLL